MAFVDGDQGDEGDEGDKSNEINAIAHLNGYFKDLLFAGYHRV